MTKEKRESGGDAEKATGNPRKWDGKNAGEPAFCAKSRDSPAPPPAKTLNGWRYITEYCEY